MTQRTPGDKTQALRRPPRRMAALLVPLALAACATVQSGALSCPAGLRPVRTAELLFGRNIGAREGVSEQDWRRFLDREVTPRFPAGLTVTDAHGQWRDGAGVIRRERAKGLLLVLTGEAGEAAKLAAVREAYRTRFRQEAVLLIERTACAAF